MPMKVKMMVEVMVEAGSDIRDEDTAYYTADFIKSALRMAKGLQVVGVQINEYSRGGN